MKVYFVRDYRNRTSQRFGMSTGIYWSFAEPVRSMAFQIRGIGSIEMYWINRNIN